jgi:hypothetical protein
VDGDGLAAVGLGAGPGPDDLLLKPHVGTQSADAPPTEEDASECYTHMHKKKRNNKKAYAGMFFFFKLKNQKNQQMQLLIDFEANGRNIVAEKGRIILGTWLEDPKQPKSQAAKVTKVTGSA